MDHDIFLDNWDLPAPSSELTLSVRMLFTLVSLAAVGLGALSAALWLVIT